MISEIDSIIPVLVGADDDILIVAASWEARCLGILPKLESYRAKHVIFVAYDEDNPVREKNIAQMLPTLSRVGELHMLRANHGNPLENVRAIVELIRKYSGDGMPSISLDTTSFTKMHLLQLLGALDLQGLGGRMNLYYTEPLDFPTGDNQPRSYGISNVRAIETFTGAHRPSNDDILILFLGYEGARALALWQHLEPNRTFAVIPDPPYRPSWQGRTETQNLYLLSSLDPSNVLRCHSLDPLGAEQLLEKFIVDGRFPTNAYNFFIGPLGTKPQTVGIFRFWRKHRGICTLMYASPVGDRYDQVTFPAGRTWLTDSTRNW